MNLWWLISRKPLKPVSTWLRMESPLSWVPLAQSERDCTTFLIIGWWVSQSSPGLIWFGPARDLMRLESSSRGLFTCEWTSFNTYRHKQTHTPQPLHPLLLWSHTQLCIAGEYFLETESDTILINDDLSSEMFKITLISEISLKKKRFVISFYFTKVKFFSICSYNPRIGLVKSASQEPFSVVICLKVQSK